MLGLHNKVIIGDSLSINQAFLYLFYLKTKLRLLFLCPFHDNLKSTDPLCLGDVILAVVVEIIKHSVSHEDLTELHIFKTFLEGRMEGFFYF